MNRFLFIAACCILPFLKGLASDDVIDGILKKGAMYNAGFDALYYEIPDGTNGKIFLQRIWDFQRKGSMDVKIWTDWIFSGILTEQMPFYKRFGLTESDWNVAIDDFLIDLYTQTQDSEERRCLAIYLWNRSSLKVQKFRELQKIMSFEELIKDVPIRSKKNRGYAPK